MSSTQEFPIGPWVRVALDGTTIFHLSQSEMGQGSYTGLAQTFAEEMDADWTCVRVEMAPPGSAYRMSLMGYVGQFVGGSLSACLWTDVLRKGGAAVRKALIQTAAERWNVNETECRAEAGMVFHRFSDRRLGFGDLAEAASIRALDMDPALKDPSEFRLIGKPLRRLDSRPKMEGKAIFGIDVRVEGMLHATPKVCPVLGGKLIGYDDAAARRIPGVVAVVPIENGVVVVADSFWQALQGAEAVTLQVDAVAGATISSDWIEESLRIGVRSGGVNVRNEGDAQSGLQAAGSILEAEYYVPYLAHATLEPVNCVASVEEGLCRVWAPTQGQDVVRNRVSAALGIKEEDVEVNTTFLGGGFGRKFFPDFVVQAVLASKAVGRPVKLIWTRAEEFAHDHYRPALLASFRGSLEQGKLSSIEAKIGGQGLLTQIFPIWTSSGEDEATVEGTRDLPYAIPNISVEVVGLDIPIPLGFLRSVGRFGNAFFVESFLDEAAHLAGKDPYLFRREMLLDDPRALAVLDAVATMSGWSTPPPAGRARGFAYHPYGGRGGNYTTPTAQVAEISLDEGGRLRVHKVWCALDCGLAINPRLIEAQIEGGIGFALSAALHSEVTFLGGAVQQQDYNNYGALRLEEMPEIAVQILPSDFPPGGVAECAVPPLAPAVANAIFALCGKRIRRLPFRRDGIKAASVRGT